MDERVAVKIVSMIEPHIQSGGFVVTERLIRIDNGETLATNTTLMAVTQGFNEAMRKYRRKIQQDFPNVKHEEHWCSPNPGGLN